MHSEQIAGAPKRKFDVWRVATAALAVTVVALAAALVLTAGSEEAPTTSSADASAELGCRLLTEIPEGGYSEDEAGLQDAHRLTTIGSLAYLAAAQDDEYGDLEDTMGGLMEAAAQMRLTTDEFPDTLESARQSCADHGF